MNHLLAAGLLPYDAVLQGSRDRLRPILMTTAAMALAVVPLILAEGAGAAARYSIGLVIFTGMMVGTVFTLFVVPMFYTYISRNEAAFAADMASEARATGGAHGHV